MEKGEEINDGKKMANLHYSRDTYCNLPDSLLLINQFNRLPSSSSKQDSK